MVGIVIEGCDAGGDGGELAWIDGLSDASAHGVEVDLGHSGVSRDVRQYSARGRHPRQGGAERIAGGRGKPMPLVRIAAASRWPINALAFR